MMAVRLHIIARALAMSTHYDVIIISIGHGGGTFANTLATSDKKIILLERGG
jgi:choline dehydrogenase-like flavoprotein